ncbi:uncharacterized protein LOC110968192 isoform X2 [Acanthochromis polyacanthus]|uniref:uncharacterized protein LOC110968192 isoform X2 n=1 Tax=Acanthochromis polyacanthus TaxID=80966 RepID=UPI002234813B|nr:uncharacterized protein LOC110968192 isoform X2 [Acanthochromis polyacanthus]
MKSDAKKQREFFEKKKMQQKLKNLGLALPAASPADTGPGSMDLVTLFIVNQIAAKKASTDPPKVAVLGSSKGGSKRNKPLVLPMSPCSPSQLSLVDSQRQSSVQEVRRRKNVIPQGFKCRQLSPVLESAFSDNSASDYRPPRTVPSSPFSSISSTSSGQEIFPLQLKQQKQSQLQPLAHCSSASWNASGFQQNKFQPFSQPRGMTDAVPWSCGSNLLQQETPTAAHVLFRNPQLHKTETGDCAGHTANFSLNQPEDNEPILDFMLNQSKATPQFEEDVFSGFNNEEYEASHFGSAKSKIYPTDEKSIRPSTPQTVPDSQCMEVEFSNCTDMNFSCLGHYTEPMNGFDRSPNCSCGGGYYSSDSNDEDCCQPSLQASYMDLTCGAEPLNPNSTSQGYPKHSVSQSRPPTPLIKSKENFRNDQKVMKNMRSPDRAFGSSIQQTGSSTALFLSPLSPTQSSELCKCKKTPIKTQDAATQTAQNPRAEMCDASTQCTFVAKTKAAPGWYLPPVDVSEQHLATERQTDTATEPATLTVPSEISSSEGKQMTWSNKKLKSSFRSGIVNIFPASNCGKMVRQRPINPFLDALSSGRGKENGGGGDQRRQRENPLKAPSDEGKEEVTSGTGVIELSKEAETLQEIADILLLMKQRKKEG